MELERNTLAKHIDYLKLHGYSEDYFSNWVYNLDFRVAKKDKKIKFISKDWFLNFNYTSTLEKPYGIVSEKILYIHGAKDQEYILAQNQSKDIPFKDTYNSYEDPYSGEITSDEDIIVVQVKEKINETYDNLINSYSTNSDKIIEKSVNWFKRFAKVHEVIFMGQSMRNEDLKCIITISQLIRKDYRIIIYYHDSRNRYQEIFKKYFTTNKSELKYW